MDFACFIGRSAAFGIERMAARSVLLCILPLSLVVLGCAVPARRSDSRPVATDPVEEQSVHPGINDDYRSGDIPKFQGRLETESREVYRERASIVQALHIRPGAAVADVGAGTGLFTLLLADAVGPHGHVYAGDIFPDFLRFIADRAQAAGLRNVECVLGTEHSAELPRSSCDLIFLCDTYHHFEYPRGMLASLRNALRPGGRLAIVDFERIDGVSPAWIFDHVRAGRQQVIAEIEAAGFRRVEALSPSFLKDNYLELFELRP